MKIQDQVQWRRIWREDYEAKRFTPTIRKSLFKAPTKLLGVDAPVDMGDVDDENTLDDDDLVDDGLKENLFVSNMHEEELKSLTLGVLKQKREETNMALSDLIREEKVAVEVRDYVALSL